jgi:dihydroneopterin aldolase
MGVIALKNIRIYAYHGCLGEEAIIGSDYIVDLKVKTNLNKASETDDLNDTVDYVLLNRIVVEEMKIRSKLLEQVAQRVLTRIINEAKNVEKAIIKVSKVNPPIGGDVEKVTIKMKLKNS